MSRRAEILALLADSVGSSSERELEKLIESCMQDDYPKLWIAFYHDRLVGVMRLDARDRLHCTITHIAVDANLRGRGVGRKLIEFIRDELDFKQAEAKTDDDALSFYKACGFEVDSIGENSFGIQRYRCVVHL